MKENNYMYDRYEERNDFSLCGNKKISSKQGSNKKKKKKKNQENPSVYSSKHVRKTISNISIKNNKKT
jgi:hypothetical protein